MRLMEEDELLERMECAELESVDGREGSLTDPVFFLRKENLNRLARSDDVDCDAGVDCERF